MGALSYPFRWLLQPFHRARRTVQQVDVIARGTGNVRKILCAWRTDQESDIAAEVGGESPIRWWLGSMLVWKWRQGLYPTITFAYVYDTIASQNVWCSEMNSSEASHRKKAKRWFSFWCPNYQDDWLSLDHRPTSDADGSTRATMDRLFLYSNSESLENIYVSKGTVNTFSLRYAASLPNGETPRT